MKQSEAALRRSQARLAREVAALRRLHEMTGRVVTTSDRQQALDEILSASVDILEADFGNIQLLDQGSQMLVIVAQIGFAPSFLEQFGEVETDDDAACGRALRHGRRVFIADVEADALYKPYLAAAREAGYRAVQSTPLVNHQGQVVGILSTHYRQPRTLTERDEQLLDLLAHQAANLIERLRAEERLEKRVQERTIQVRQLASELITAEQTVRHRLAHTLHDDMQQLLYAAKLQLKFLRDEIGEQAELDDLAQMISQAFRLTRQLTVELSPPLLKEEDLYEALAWLARHMDEIYGLKVTIEADDHPQTASREQRILLFQIVRELLFNMVKHAGVLAAAVRLQEEDEGISVSVSNQGKGFELATMPNDEDEGFGLHSISERLQLFGGQATIASRPGEETRITLFIPYTIGG